MWRSGRSEEYRSSVWKESRTRPGVRYEVARVSLERRLELARRVSELRAKLRFEGAREGLDARLAVTETQCAIDVAYLEWGLLGVEGLKIDGEPATVETVISKGPEELAREMAEAVRGESGLSEAEIKN